MDLSFKRIQHMPINNYDTKWQAYSNMKICRIKLSVYTQNFNVYYF